MTKDAAFITEISQIFAILPSSEFYESKAFNLWFCSIAQKNHLSIWNKMVFVASPYQLAFRSYGYKHAKTDVATQPNLKFMQ